MRSSNEGNTNSDVPPVVTILIGQVFFLAGINKLAHHGTNIALKASPTIGTWNSISAVLLLCSGSPGDWRILGIGYGHRDRWTALVPATFVVLVTSVFDWDFAKEMNVHLFRKDLATAGELWL